MTKQENAHIDDHLRRIGEVSRIGGITRRTLRHYDKLKIIEPDYVGENGYRYYSLRTMLKIPVANYLKGMGLSLEEVSEVIHSGDLGQIKNLFAEHRELCSVEARRLQERTEIIDDWNSLIDEANFVLNAHPETVGVKFMPEQDFLAMPYRFNGDYAEATINLEFTAFVEENDNVISGPVILRHSDYREGLSGSAACGDGAGCDVMVLQKALRAVAPENRYHRDGGLYLSTYHTGSFEGMGAAYERIARFADEQGYRLRGWSYERFVTDYWTTYDSDLFVAEVLIPLEGNTTKSEVSGSSYE